MLSKISVRNRRDIKVFCVFRFGVLFDLPISHLASRLNGHIFCGFFTVSTMLVELVVVDLASLAAFRSLQLRIFLVHVPHRSTIASFLPQSIFIASVSKCRSIGLRAVVLISESAAIFPPFVCEISGCVVFIWLQYCF